MSSLPSDDIATVISEGQIVVSSQSGDVNHPEGAVVVASACGGFFFFVSSG